MSYHYTVYRITNIINGHFYVGMHKTKNLNDGYMGSGKRLHAAFRKYGKNNFTKDILYFCESEEEMISKEIEEVGKILSDHRSYNIKPGGIRGPGGKIGRVLSEESKKKLRDNHWSKKGGKPWNKGLTKEDPRVADQLSKMVHTGFLGKNHSNDTKEKIRDAAIRKWDRIKEAA